MNDSWSWVSVYLQLKILLKFTDCMVLVWRKEVAFRSACLRARFRSPQVDKRTRGSLLDWNSLDCRRTHESLRRIRRCRFRSWCLRSRVGRCRCSRWGLRGFRNRWRSWGRGRGCRLIRLDEKLEKSLKTVKKKQEIQFQSDWLNYLPEYVILKPASVVDVSLKKLSLIGPGPIYGLFGTLHS